MKKILGISLVAVLAVSPLMANAATGEVVSTGTTPATVTSQPASAEAASTAGLTAGSPYYALATEAATDGNAASAGYVKGAYNAAIKAVNSVHAEVAQINTDMDDKADKNLGNVADGQVAERLIGSGAVTEAKIGTGAVTADKIGANAVTTAKIMDANVTANKLATDSVTTAKIVDGNVTTAKLADEAVTTAKLADEAVTIGKIESDNIAGGTAQGATNNQLTTKDYVDEKVGALGSVATEEGVVATIKNTGITVTDNKTVSLSGGVTGTNPGTITVMTNWTDPTQTTTHSYIGGVSNDLAVSLGGTITADINDGTVSYSETVTQ